ncbi:MAG TPA: Mur ligase family protein [Acidimicrobiales bacterium]|nr:Mur ligase family protein [Acidimicrobiales bacterium]
MIVVVVALQLLTVLDALRWLRVAQREHYIAGSVTRFAARWFRLGIGLPLFGRTSKLVWTRRLRVLAAFTVVIDVGVLAALAALTPLWLASLLALVLLPATVDGALLLATPIEERALKPFLTQAADKLKTIAPTIVGITGSYGKTSTKVVLAHLVNGTKSVAASPASFNNRAGLARAVNEGLSAGTDVFVAEMGTYGPGEIAALCAWCPPTISMITAIGPVHLERFGSEDVTLTAKSEILETASTVILNEDDARLAKLADTIAAEGKKRLLRASATRVDADVAVLADDEGARVYENGALAGRVAQLPTAPTNVACAIAAARALGVPMADIVARLGSAPVASHRLETATAPSGAVVLDDTFNSNPAGARRALALLASSGSPAGRKVLITPGMIELGPRQFEENAKFATDAAAVASIIGIVGHTNRKALLKGLAGTNVDVKKFRTREKAAAWVRGNLTAGDVVLYENDLPDIYR